jgi:hypothetical protein
MADLRAVLEQLKEERDRAKGELKQLAKVIELLSKLRKRSSQASSGMGRRKQRQLSAAARERIAAAQKARWAKARAQSKKAP